MVFLMTSRASIVFFFRVVLVSHTVSRKNVGKPAGGSGESVWVKSFGLLYTTGLFFLEAHSLLFTTAK